MWQKDLFKVGCQIKNYKKHQLLIPFLSQTSYLSKTHSNIESWQILKVEVTLENRAEALIHSIFDNSTATKLKINPGGLNII